MLKNMTKRVKL